MVDTEVGVVEGLEEAVTVDTGDEEIAAEMFSVIFSSSASRFSSV